MLKRWRALPAWKRSWLRQDALMILGFLIVLASVIYDATA